MLDPLREEERYTQTKFWVEATSFEMHALWEKFSKQNTMWKDPRLPEHDFQQINAGEIITVGKVNGLPVCVSVFWYYIDGVRVGFYHATSRMVDYDMVKMWFRKRYPVKYDNGHRNAYTDASNFHLCLHALKELSKGK